jgi:hypothetical protein
MKHGLVLLILLMASAPAMAQERKTPENSLHPSTGPQKFPTRKEISKRERIALKPKSTVDLQKEYYQRVEDVMKARRKAARQMEKPQYSDPLYFGHKRPPKKHSARNMRFCKECGIRH